MIQVEPLPDGGATVNLTTRQPLVYLDQWALHTFAKDDGLRAHLLRIFETKGTLMFSFMNIAEISALAGDSRRRIEALLAGVGVNWFPLDANAVAVMGREDRGLKLHAPFDEEMARRFYSVIHGDEVLSLAKVASLTDEDPAGNKAFLDAHKAAFIKFIADKKAAVKANPALAENFRPVPFEPNRPARYVYFHVFGPILTDPGLHLSENDAIDVFHAVVAGAYCDAVLLDNKWVKVVNTLAFPPNRLRAYGPNDIPAFLDFMERAHVGS